MISLKKQCIKSITALEFSDLPTLVTPFAGLFSFAIYELKTMLSGDSTLIMYPKISSISLVASFT